MSLPEQASENLTFPIDAENLDCNDSTLAVYCLYVV